MIDFPASPTENQMFQAPGGPRYVYSNGGWRMSDPGPPGTAQTRNRIVNGAMQISQENGNTAAVGDGYRADQWATTTPATGGGVVTSQRVQVPTPNGSKDRLRYTITTALASLSSGDQLVFRQWIEGNRVADFRWGSASAKQVILRFGFKAPAGTYPIALHNSAYDRSYVALFTIAAGQANTDTVQTFATPGDTTGTWLTDTGTGLLLEIGIATGPGKTGVTGWQAGFMTAAAGCTNGMATVGNVFELFDVGLYLDPLATGVAPRWEMPDEAQEQIACQRYWENGSAGNSNLSTWQNHGFKATKRIAPAVTMVPNPVGGLGVTVDTITWNHSATTGFTFAANARM